MKLHVRVYLLYISDHADRRIQAIATSIFDSYVDTHRKQQLSRVRYMARYSEQLESKGTGIKREEE